MPSFGSSGGDLIDQMREWLDRQRARLTGGRNGASSGGAAAARRGGRRAGGRSQAIPVGSPRAAATARTGRGGRYGTGRSDRATRGTFTVILATVLVVGVIALFFAVRWALSPSGGTPSNAGTPVPAAASPLPGPGPISSPPPFPLPSPSPSPTAALAAPQQRIHTVEGGDTLNRIAQRYGTTVDAIVQANNFTDRNRILRIGERLVIPEPLPASPIPR